MSNMRDLINTIDTIDILNERQNHRELNGVVDKFAKPGMTLADLEAMEAEAKLTKTQGDGFLGGLGAAVRSIGQTEGFKLNYVLYHAGEKLGLETGLIGTDGKVRTLDGAQYSARRLSTSSNQDRNIALAQAKINLLPQRVQTALSIPQGGGDIVRQPTKEYFFSPDAISLQPHNIETFRGKEPYVDIQLRGELTRVYTREANVAALQAKYRNATVMKADGTGPLNPVDNDAKASSGGVNDGSDAAQNAAGSTANATKPEANAVGAAADAVAPKYKDSISDFVASNEKGLANNPEATGAIKELNNKLADLDFPGVTRDSEEYNREAVRAFQNAYNAMGDNRIATDGDFGPNTNTALERIEADFEAIERLVNNNAVNDSVIYKSSISKMLESLINEELTQTQLGDLTRRLVAIDKFIGGMPEGYTISNARKELLIKGRLAIKDHITGVSREPTSHITNMSGGRITAISTGAATRGLGSGRGAYEKSGERVAYQNAQNGQEGEAGAKTSSSAGRFLAALIHDAVEDGFIRADGNQIIERLQQVDNKQDFLDAVVSYKTQHNEDMMDVLNTAAMRDTRFYPRYYRELQRLEIPHTLPDNPRRLRLQTMNGREWDELFGENASKYQVNADRKYEYNPGGAAEAKATSETFDWGKVEGQIITGNVTIKSGAETLFEYNHKNRTLTISITGTNTRKFYTDIIVTNDKPLSVNCKDDGKDKTYKFDAKGYENITNALKYVYNNWYGAAQ